MRSRTLTGAIGVIALCLHSTVAAGGVAASAGAAPDATILDVPFVTQTGALCGGAALAMVMRFWGEPGIRAEEFAPLASRSGIRAQDLVEAARARGWRTLVVTGGLAEAERQLRNHRPVIALVRERLGTNHYVVLTGTAGDRVVVHDPVRGPFRSVQSAPFERAWAKAGGWGLLVLPPERQDASAPPPEEATQIDPMLDSECALHVASAVRSAEAGDLDAAERALRAASRRCPAAATPLAELAGVSFRRGRLAAAESLAARAVAAAPGQTYAARLLATIRFVRGDPVEALAAWNRVQEPRIDLTRVQGLDHTHHAAVTRLVGLESGTVLRESDLRRARRRAESLPSRQSVRVSYEPLAAGAANVSVVVVERPLWALGGRAVPVALLRAFVEREARVDLSSPAGGGELWTARWRWSERRPALEARVDAPGWGGIWSASAAWERQRGRTLERMERRRVAAGHSRWATADTRWHAGAALERWTARGRDVRVEAGIERRWAQDRLAVRTGGSGAVSTTHAPAYATGSMLAEWWSSRAGERPPVRLHARAGIATVSEAAPLLLWPRSGSDARSDALLRAHPSFDAGVLVRAGSARHLAHGGVEAQWWPWTVNALAFGIATFVDVADARPASGSASLQADAGAGLRFGLAGHAESLRIDFARGLRDGAFGWSLGFQLAR